MKKTILLISLIYSSYSNAQISIYSSDDNGKFIIGYSISASNENFKRDRNAENDCRNNGGKNPRQERSSNGYGCYAIVRGTKNDGAQVFGWSSGGNKTVDDCIREAKSEARFRGAVESSINIYRQAQGCVTAPAPNNQNTPNSTSQEPQFSAWKKINGSKCDVGIEYCTKRVERYQLNYQLWFYYKVRNTSNKNIRFDFHLTRNGKKEFGRGHVLSPGGEDQWMHKMSANNIDGVSVTNVINTATNKGVCDENSAGNQNNTESDKELIDEINSYLYQIDDNNPTKKAIMQRVSQAQNSKSLSQASYISLLKRERESAKRLLESLGNSKVSNTNNNKTINEEIQDLAYRKSIACGKLRQQGKPFNASLCAEGYNGRLAENEYEVKEYLIQLRNQVKTLEGEEIKETKIAEERAENERKANEEKAEKYHQYMSNGETALRDNEYDNAINNFVNAKSYAATNSEVQAATNAIARAQKAKADAARKIRVEEKQKVEKKQNDATLAAATSYVGMMALVKDAYSPHWFAAKFQVGLGYGSTGIISNSAFYNKSSTKSSNQYQFRLGFKFGFANNKGISLHLNPLLDIGVNAYQLGIDGSSTGYGGTGTLFLGKKGRSKIKLFAEAGYLNTSGSYNYDQAVAEGRGSTSDNVENATYKFSTIKYGGGIMFHFISGGEETFIKPGIFFEKPSFAQNNASPVMVGNLQVNVNSTIIIDFSYSKNYLIGGQLAYPFNFTKNDINFWSIKLIRQGKLR